jgi:hypothetical protein
MADFTKSGVRNWMRAHLGEYRDECGSIDATKMAEGAADAFDQADHPGPLDD